jgi:hypothetical protein
VQLDCSLAALQADLLFTPVNTCSVYSLEALQANFEDPFLEPLTCVTKMIKHIVAESALIFKGTKYEDSWVFYHDALSLMTAKETIMWMKEKGFHEQWLLQPVMGLHSDDPDLKTYLNTIPGSSPENMPWDLSLN